MNTCLEIKIKSDLSNINKGLIKLILLIWFFFSNETNPFSPLPLTILIKKFSYKSSKWWPSKRLFILCFLHFENNNWYLFFLAIDWIFFFGFFPFQIKISELIFKPFNNFFIFLASSEDSFLSLWSTIKNLISSLFLIE